ncbi:Predicted DNA-binding protein, MmcQ/YjbR family [Nakamurella panacisegetis]|uniref:Predicted DNA-binding protein, MmcQ/YjbR family n=1 Tax=Nakamurella panacisegetis TaxID=1090615 RepID=A0A1H0RUM5_9ACTN|nr:MmcQ/YjbR family DNA-binding protein [Nakamurella panacisegetis]SDP33029.1 Predicted DNA-binding protein, MmcQ/YjbR family [Nakamurella panacisegetis]
MLGAAAVRAYCLDLPDVREDYPFGSVPQVCTFKVAGKIFLLSALAAPPPLQISVKCDPEIAVTLRAAYPAVVPGYHLNKRHWNTVSLDGSVPDELVLEMIQDSFDLVVDKLPRHQRIRLR